MADIGIASRALQSCFDGALASTDSPSVALEAVQQAAWVLQSAVGPDAPQQSTQPTARDEMIFSCNPAVLVKTRANVTRFLELHPHATTPTVAELEWGPGEQVCERIRALGVSTRVDVVLAADCIYVLDHPGAWGKLLTTVEALAAAQTLTFVTYTDRGHDKLWRRFLERVSKRFHVVRVVSHLLHPIAQPGAVGRLEQLTPEVQVFCWTLRVGVSSAQRGSHASQVQVT